MSEMSNTGTKLHLQVEVPYIENRVEQKQTVGMYFAKVYITNFNKSKFVFMLAKELAKSSKKSNRVHQTLQLECDTRGWYFKWSESVSVTCHKSNTYDMEVGERVLNAKIELRAMKTYNRLMRELFHIARDITDEIGNRVLAAICNVVAQETYINDNF